MLNLKNRNFLSGSLDQLFQRIRSTCKYKIMKQSSLLSYSTGRSRKPLLNQNERLFCMNKKGVFPYSWAQSAACYNLPYLVEKEHFFNTLTQSHISDEDYNFAKQVWKTFEMRTMKDYCRMYCLTGKLISYAFSLSLRKSLSCLKN